MPTKIEIREASLNVLEEALDKLGNEDYAIVMEIFDVPWEEWSSKDAKELFNMVIVEIGRKIKS